MEAPRQAITVFQRRFGGAVSLEQELTDLTGELPLWARPIWQLVLSWLLPKIRELRIARTMDAVDKQAKAIGDGWSQQDRQATNAWALRQAQADHPDAHVEVIAMPHHPVDAIYIEHPPTPGSRAQELLGFGAIEIRAPHFNPPA